MTALHRGRRLHSQSLGSQNGPRVSDVDQQEDVSLSFISTRPLHTDGDPGRFDGGVTCIQTSPHQANLMAVGSCVLMPLLRVFGLQLADPLISPRYNSTVALFDPRYPLRPLFDPIPIGGGAWRVKFHPSPSRSKDILVACMHDGFKVVRLLDDASEGKPWELVTRFDGHESLAYGCDWSHDLNSGLVGSCSFYDHTMCLWNA